MRSREDGEQGSDRARGKLAAQADPGGTGCSSPFDLQGAFQPQRHGHQGPVLVQQRGNGSCSRIGRAIPGHQADPLSLGFSICKGEQLQEQLH
ncbi:unnamed protein product [Rangifer tarandus platyrhynchus]|uniref:Uncharacterized protein n=1 Tax=Rangifer tarandus platyrhynchus TaxID=3082113 RepID=A0ABN8ZA31_RANTA|nr:unnamed protein product [Rangifer tarandus platyrhynchus]CAI9687953.1 unnamed protein product [Rangifer tarandus platyrhynchus]